MHIRTPDGHTATLYEDGWSSSTPTVALWLNTAVPRGLTIAQVAAWCRDHGMAVDDDDVDDPETGGATPPLGDDAL